MEEYLSDRGYGSSQLKPLINGTPADFKSQLAIAFKETKATKIGTAIHTAILEPLDFVNDYLLQPEYWGPLNKNPGKAKWAEFQAANPGKICLDWHESKKVTNAIEASHKSTYLQDLLADGAVEVTGFYQDDNVRLKARSDLQTEMADGSYMFWDIKTTSKPMNRASLNSVVDNFHYAFQAAHHMHVFKKLGMNVSGFGWIFISTDSPATHVTIRPASDEVLEVGNRQFLSALEILKECESEDYWPGYEQYDGMLIELPKWKQNND
jgi:hypothetical protein